MTKTTFPASVWDGTTGSRPNFSVSRGPTGVDWDRAIEEIRAIQNTILNRDIPDKLNGRTVTGLNESVLDTDQVIYIDATSNNVTVAVPDPSLNNDRVIQYKRVDTSLNTVTLNGTLDGVVSPTLEPGESRTTHAHASTWRII